HPTVKGRIYVAAEAGALIRSFDGGRTWEDRVPGGPWDSHTVVIHPDQPDRIYSAAGDGYFESLDGGDTWHKPNEGLPYGYFWSVAIDPSDTETIVVSSSPGAGAGHGHGRGSRAGLYRKERGTSWQASSKGLPEEEGTVLPILAT